MITQLGFGEFIGRRERALATHSFHFAEMVNAVATSVPLHSHEDAHFVLVLRGRYATSARHVESPCGPSTVLFMPRGTTHRDHCVGVGGRFVTVSVDPSRLTGIGDELDAVADPIALPKGEPAWIAARAWREMQTTDSAARLVLEGLGFELLGCIVRLGDGARATAPAWLRRASRMIEERCADAITVREIAAAVGVHPYHLARTFRRFLRTSPGEYLRECRVRRATDLLRRTRGSLAEIALQCGYAGQSQFTRSFRRQTGMTPGAMRSTSMCRSAHEVERGQDGV